MFFFFFKKTLLRHNSKFNFVILWKENQIFEFPCCITLENLSIDASIATVGLILTWDLCFSSGKILSYFEVLIFSWFTIHLRKFQVVCGGFRFLMRSSRFVLFLVGGQKTQEPSSQLSTLTHDDGTPATLYSSRENNNWPHIELANFHDDLWKYIKKILNVLIFHCNSGNIINLLLQGTIMHFLNISEFCTLMTSIFFTNQVHI